MDDDKNILLNYLLAKNDKSYKNKNDSDNQNIIENNDNSKIDITNNKEIDSSINNNNINKYDENNNRNEKSINLDVLDNKISTESKTIDLSYKDMNKLPLNLNNICEYNKKNNQEIDNENDKDNDKENDKDYNKCFKNRMDIMQAVLDDELNISSNNDNFIRRRPKSRTTVKNNIPKNKQMRFLKKENNDKINNKDKLNEIAQNYLNKYIKEKDKEKENKNNNLFKDLKQIKDEEYEGLKYDYNINHITKINKDDNKKNNRITINENKSEEKYILKDYKNDNEFFNISNKKEIKPNSINQISEEINLQICNEKKTNHRKGSYININFHNDKNNSKINSERMHIKENTPCKPIIIENNSDKKLSIKFHFNKSYIDIKKNNQNNIDNKGNFPPSKKYFSQTNIKNNKITINKNNNYNKKFPQSLDNFLNIINHNSETKNNNIREVNNSNNDIKQTIKDIKDSLLKINDIKKVKNIENNKKQYSFNNIYFHILEDSYQPMNKNMSRNFFLSKRTDISDFMSFNYANDKVENNTSLASKGISRKTNSYSNIYTLNNTGDKYYFNNQNIYNINNINNINSMNYYQIKNILEDFKYDNISKNIILSNYMKSKSFLNNKNLKAKNFINNKGYKDNIIRLNYMNYMDENTINKTDSNIKIKGINNSNFNSYLNKIGRKNIIKDSNSKNKENESNINFRKKTDIYQNEKITDKLVLDKKTINDKNYIHNTINKHNSKYVYKDSYINNKNNLEKNNRIRHIQNYSQKSNYYNYKNDKIKMKNYTFERFIMKKNHFIFPVNLFD